MKRMHGVLAAALMAALPPGMVQVVREPRGDVPPEPKPEPNRKPHQGKCEMERRRKQMAKIQARRAGE